MNKNDNIYNPDIPLILDNEVDPTLNTNNEILKINQLIKIKYLTNKNVSPLKEKPYFDSDFISIKNTTNKINDYLNEKTLLVNNSINVQENELKLLYQEKKLLDQNKIQSDIINHQLILLDNYKKNTNVLKSNSNNIQKKLEETIHLNRTLEINNNELKNSINRYISNNRKLQDTINKLKLDYTKPKLTIEQIEELNNKVKFYQQENLRLSNELISLQNNYATIKNNFTELELQKNNIYKQIHELNNSLVNDNLLNVPSIKEIVKSDSITSNVSDSISNNIEEDKNISKIKKNLNDEINNIFN
jgi:chromosome segregation ATPase